MNKIFEFILNNKLYVYIITIIVIGFGVISFQKLPIDAFPDVTNTQVMILSKAVGYSSIDVEKKVTIPLERYLTGLPGVKELRSLSKQELSQVIVIFEDKTDIYFAREIINQKIIEAKENMPENVEIELAPVSTGLGEIFQYTIESETINLADLRTIHDYNIAPLLKPIKGVTEVNSLGGVLKQYSVLVKEDKLVKYNLTFDEIIDKIEKNNEDTTAGIVFEGYEQKYLRTLGTIKDIKDIENIVLKSNNGTYIYVKDVCDIIVEHQQRYGAVTQDGKGEVIAGMVIMLKDENSKEVVDKIKEKMKEIKSVVGKDVKINVFYDRTTLIEACIETVINALNEGSVFVILILFLFLLEIRTALIVVFSLPLTFLITFIVMNYFHISSNLMSLGGLAFSVGMVVDGSIVVVENIRRFYSHNTNESKNSLTLKALNEIAKPVIFSISIIAIILIPLYTLEGIEGKMFIPLALTMFISIIASLIVAFTIIPVLATNVLQIKKEKTNFIIEKFYNSYKFILNIALNNGIKIIFVSVLLLMYSIFLFLKTGGEFMPDLDEGAIAINIVKLPNASLESSTAVSTYIEKKLRAIKEIDTIVSKSGRAEISEDAMGPEQTDIFIMLKDKKYWSKSKDELIKEINLILAKVPGIRASFSQPIALRVNELISGIKSDVAIKVFGTDIEILKQFGEEISKTVAKIKGANDVKIEQVSGMEQYELNYDKEKLSLYGLNINDVNETLKAYLKGKEISYLFEDEKKFPIVIKYKSDSKLTKDEIEKIIITSQNNVKLLLKDIAKISLKESFSQISRENGIRRLVVENNIRERDLTSFVKELNQKIIPIKSKLPMGYFIEIGGEFENKQRAIEKFAIVIPVAMLIIFILLYTALNSIIKSFIVFINLPFALTGGVFAVNLFDITMSIPAYIAFIILLGVAVQNGVVLVSFFNHIDNNNGKTFKENIIEICFIRFRPLLMTALTSFIGHLPMIYSTTAGAEIQKPLAIVVMGGIITSTLLTLFIIPIIYTMIYKNKNIKTLS